MLGSVNSRTLPGNWDGKVVKSVGLYLTLWKELSEEIKVKCGGRRKKKDTKRKGLMRGGMLWRDPGADMCGKCLDRKMKGRGV